MGFTDTLATAWGHGHSRLSDPVTYAPGVGSPVSVPGFFDALYEHIDGNTHGGVSSYGPAVFFRLVDLPSDPKVDKAARITVGTTVYKSHEVKSDGMGGVIVLLHKAS